MMRFSVIVPIFNVARFIPSGLAQLAAQDFAGEWEVILVDDGSSDGSSEMIDRVAAADPRMIALHQPNSGSGPARNLGIDHARGEYICFVDVDDELEPALLSTLNDALTSAKNPDMAVFGFDEADASGGSPFTRTFESMMLRGNDAVRDAWPLHLSGAHGGNNGFVWNKTYRRDFLIANNLKFGNERIQQDEVFNLRVYAHVESALIMPDVLYHYMIYDRGNTRSHYIANRIDIYASVIKAFRTLMAGWGIAPVEVERWLAQRFLNNVVQTLTFNCHHPESGFTRAERRAHMQAIMNRPDVRALVAEFDEHAISIGGLTKAYLRAIRRQSVGAVECTRVAERFLQALRRILRR